MAIMKFELSDDTLLKVSGVATAGYAVQMLGFAHQAQDIFYLKGERTPEHTATARWFGWGLGVIAADAIVVSSSKNSTAAKKNLLKTGGVAWLSGAAMHLYNAQDGVQRKEVAYAAAGLAVVMGSLCLWRGFAKAEDSKAEVEEAKPSKKGK